MVDEVVKFINKIEKELESRGLVFGKTYVSGGNWVSTRKAYLEIKEANKDDKYVIDIAKDGKNCGFIIEFKVTKEFLTEETNAEAFAILLI